MDPLLFTLIAEEMNYTPHTLKPEWPLAKELFSADQKHINFAEVDNHGK